MHIKRRTTQRIIEAAHALTEKDHEALLRLAVQRLEHIARLIDELDDHMEQMSQRIMSEAVQRITGAGIVNLIAKAESLSSSLKDFSSSVRHNELRLRLPPEGRNK